VMFTVSYEQQLREAFAAGQSATTASFFAKQKGAGFEHTPKTYDEWVASIRHRPTIARGDNHATSNRG
jgi:hypothetical protein